MLKSHKNLLEPHPSDRLRIGERVVDIPLREITPVSGGDAVRVTLKSLGVLLTLVAHAGRPVSREALLEWVWPDTLPTDDVVTQAITQLRKALGDDREHPRYIETLSKQGYRLIAPLEWLVETPPPAEPAVVVAMPQATAKGRTSGFKIMAAVAALTLLAGAAVWQWRDRVPVAATVAAAPVSKTDTAPLPDYQRIASLPLNERRPSLSPDGSLVVYIRGAGEESSQLMLQTSSATPPRPLTEKLPGQSDLSPTWSPDGLQIAFVRVNSERCAVMLIPAAGGSAREVGDCIGGYSHMIRWYSDSKALIAAAKARDAAGVTEMALYRMALDDGQWQRIVYEKSPTDEDMSPHVSPDGRWIAFQRNVSLGDLWRMPVAGGKPQRLTNLGTNIYGLSWMPDSRHLLFSRSVNGRVGLSKLDVASGRITDYAGDNGSQMFPTVAQNSGTVAFEVENSRSRMRQVVLADGELALDSSRLLLESSGSSLLPSVAADGRQLLFYSDRSGDLRLWWVDHRQPDTLRSFDQLMPVPRHPPMWHADSQRALVLGRNAEGVASVFEVEPRMGRVRKLPVPDGQPVHAAYHPDPNRLLVAADRGEGRLGVTLYDRSSEPWRALATVGDVAMVMPDLRNRRIVLAAMSPFEILSADLELKNPRRIDRVKPQRRNRTLVATADGVRVMDSARGCYWQWRLVAVDAAANIADRDVRCLGDIGWHLEGLSTSAAEPVLYMSVIEETQVDIGLMPASAFVDTGS